MSPPKIDRQRPEFLANLPHFNNLIVSQGGRQAHLSGLLATTPDGNLIGAGDLAAQMAHIYQNIGKTLASVGATPGHIVRQRIFIKDMKVDDRAIVAKVMNEFYGDQGRPVSTTVGTPALLVEGALVEIDVTALLDD